MHVIGHAWENFHVSHHLPQNPMRPEEQPEAPSAPWRAASAFTMGAVGLLCRGFLLGLSSVETHGMDGFLKLLDEREDVGRRERGLITGMRNHTESYCAI
jgi:monolysocardiolipin acyltransferase